MSTPTELVIDIEDGTTVIQILDVLWKVPVNYRVLVFGSHDGNAVKLTFSPPPSEE